MYANGAADTEKIAHIIYDGLSVGSVGSDAVNEELHDLSEFCRLSIHPKFLLVDLVKRGVAFHYGNMPTILRNEIERLFRKGKIRFLVCTSTLVEGVNLACRTIVVRGPRKGKGNPMSAPDFWKSRRTCWPMGRGLPWEYCVRRSAPTEALAGRCAASVSLPH